MGLERFTFKTRSKMAKFSPIKKLGTVVERWKDAKLEKTAKYGMNNPKKVKREKKDPFKKRKGTKPGKRKIFLKRERVSFLSRSWKFGLAHIPGQHATDHETRAEIETHTCPNSLGPDTFAFLQILDKLDELYKYPGDEYMKIK